MNRKMPVPSKRTLLILAWVGGILAALFIIGLMAAVASLTHDYNSLEDRADASKVDQAQLSTAVDNQAVALAEANRRLRQLGKTPVPTPPVTDTDDPVVVVGPPGPAGADGRRGPRGLRGLRGLRGFTGLPGLPGIDGTNGTDGSNGTDGQDAFPFTFVFTVSGNGLGNDHTFTCRIPDSGPVTCRESE